MSVPKSKLPVEGECFLRIYKYSYPCVLRILRIEYSGDGLLPITADIFVTRADGEQVASEMSWGVLVLGINKGEVTKLTQDEYAECIHYANLL